jgi:signal transduction histidine kinase
VPVELDATAERAPQEIEATAYFVIAEALTNVAKHARAKHVSVTARIEDGRLRLEVRDNGAGGARADGSGLLGLRDRVAAHDGSLIVDSPLDGGTRIAAELPVQR